MHRNPWKAATLVLAALAVLAVPVAVSAASSFVDVPDSNIFSGDIEWLASANVTQGCNPPTNDMFCPTQNVTRQQMAAFMHRLATNQVVDAGTVQGLAPDDLRPLVYTTRVEGPVAITGVNDFESVASLALRPGKYLFQAKAWYWNNSTTDAWADCRLVTPNVDDDVWVDVAAADNNDQHAASFLAVDELTASTTVSLTCRDGGYSVVANEIVIVATPLSDYFED
ncbi:MAG: S-layer homology domain-containing protein [Acidimicrobiia bacterium]